MLKSFFQLTFIRRSPLSTLMTIPPAITQLHTGVSDRHARTPKATGTPSESSSNQITSSIQSPLRYKKPILTELPRSFMRKTN